MKPQSEKPVSSCDDSYVSRCKKTLDGALLMVVDNLALRIKKGLPPLSPRPDTEIEVFIIEGFV
jgi:hypothetical protein